jgi:hypothetical protein
MGRFRNDPRTIAKADGPQARYWYIIADNLKKRGWSLGYVSAVDSRGRTIWIADAHRDGKRCVVHADEMLTAFVELESAVREADSGCIPSLPWAR